MSEAFPKATSLGEAIGEARARDNGSVSRPRTRLLSSPSEWRDKAACAEAEDPDTWHPENTGSVAGRKSVDRAIWICFGCPVIDECLTYALEHREYGIWGGTTEEERRALRRQNASFESQPSCDQPGG